MKKKLVILTLIVAITVMFLSFAQFTYAKDYTPFTKHKMIPYKSSEFKEMMGRRLEDSPAAKMRVFIESLSLSEEQKAEINKAILDFQKDTVALRNSIQIKELEVRALLLEPQTELVKVRAKLQEIADLQVELKVKTIEKYLEIKDLLTPEQQEKLPLGVSSQIFALGKSGSGRMMKSYCW